MESAPVAPVSLALPRAELLAAASHTYLTSVAHLSAGHWLTKYPFSEKGGAPSRRFLWYGVDSVEGDCLFWAESDRKKRAKSKTMTLRSVTGVLEAAQTAAFKKAMDSRRLDESALPLCFSVVSGRRTLDLQAASVEERDHFIAALHCVLSHKQLNKKQQAVALATAHRSSMLATHAITGAVSAPNSPLSLTKKKDLFVITIKARNLPVMPWRGDDDSNDTLISIFEKTARTNGAFSFVESSEWQLSNAMPNFRTPLLVPVGLPIETSDLIKIVVYDQRQDDAHIAGTVVVRAEFFQKNAGHEMMVKLKNSVNRDIDQLLVQNNSYLLLTSTCKTGGVGGGGRAASRAPLVAPTTRQVYGSVLQEFQHAVKRGTAAAKAEMAAQAAGLPAPVTHMRAQSAGGDVEVSAPVTRNGANRRLSLAEELLISPSNDGGARDRRSSVALPRTVIAFLQAGGSFTFYPPRRPIDAATRTLDVPCAVTVRLQMKGAFGHLVLRTADAGDGSDDESEVSSTGESSPKPSFVFLSIPFELVFQAKLGTAPGCFNLPDVHAYRRPKPSHCLSLLIRTSASPHAKIAYWLDLESSSALLRDAWVQAITEVNAYIHTPARRASVVKKAVEVDAIQSPLPNEPTSPAPPIVVVQSGRKSLEGVSAAARPVDEVASTALSFLDPPPEKRSAVDVARKAAKTLGTSNVMEDVPPAPLTRDIYSAPDVRSMAPLDAPPMPPPVMGDDGDVPMAPGMDGIPVAPGMGGPSMPAVRNTGPRLRRLLWDPVDADGAEGTLWSESDEDGDASATNAVWQEGHALLVQLFSLADAKAGRLLNVKAKQEERGVTIFDSKRGQNIEIALRAFRMPNAALHEAVLAMDMTILNAERLTSLIACCPTADELRAMRRWEVKQGRSPDYSTLPKAEQFAFLMQSIPHYALRLRGLLFRLKYADMVDGLVKHFGKLSRACQAVRDSRRFRHVLRLILSIGNAMNRSASKGFHLASLDELSRTKSADGKSTLVDFIVSYLHLRQQRRGGKGEDSELVSECDADEPYLAQLSSVLQHVRLVDVAALQDERGAVVQGLAELEAEVAALKTEREAHPQAAIDGDEFVEQMTDFVDEAHARAALLHEQWVAFQERQADLLSYLNEVGELGISDVFGLLARFCDALAAAEGRRVDKAKKDEQAASKHRRMHTEPMPPSSVAQFMAKSAVQDAINAHAHKRKEDTWDEQ